MKTAFLFLLAFLPARMPAQVKLDLRQCREMALRHSRDMQMADKQRQKAACEIRMYKANFLPAFSITGMGVYHRKKYAYRLKGGFLPEYKPGADGQPEPDLKTDPATGEVMTGPDGKPLFNGYALLPDIGLELSLRGLYSAGIRMEMPLYGGGKVRSAFRMAKLGGAIAEANVRLSRSDLLFETDRAYWQFVGAKEQVLATEKYEEAVRELLGDLQDARAVGMAVENDVLKARVRQDEAALMSQQTRHARTLARMNLCRLIGLELQTEVNVQDSLSETVDPQIWQLDSAVSQRPDYHMLMRETDLKEQQVKLDRSAFLPQVGVTAAYGYGGGLKLNGDGDSGAAFTAVAAVTVPVFHWGEGRNKIRSSRMDEEISRLQLKKSAELMQLEIASARFGIQDAQTRVRMARNALRQAEENLRTGTDRFRAGMENLTSLLEAQAQWQRIRSQWIDAKAALHLSISAYLKAIGKLE